MAEGAGFEPAKRLRSHDFESRAFNHSATPPHKSNYSLVFQPAIPRSGFKIRFSFKRFGFAGQFLGIMFDPWHLAFSASYGSRIMRFQPFLEVSTGAFVEGPRFLTSNYICNVCHLTIFASPRSAGQATRPSHLPFSKRRRGSTTQPPLRNHRNL